MTSLYVHPRLGEVTLSQTVRARRISISVRATGAVRLSFPCGVPQKRALDFLEQKAEWIGAARERLARKRASLPPQLPPEERKARIEELRRAAKADNLGGAAANVNANDNVAGALPLCFHSARSFPCPGSAGMRR